MQTLRKRVPEDISDYIHVFKRHHLWFILPAIIVSVIGASVVLLLPKKYQSDTLVLVERQKVPPDYVKPTVSSDVSLRLQTITQEVLSRTRLQSIIDQLGLYRDARKNHTQEEIVDQMRTDIQIQTVLDERAQQRGQDAFAFKVSYSGTDPRTVQEVTRELASLFINANLKARAAEAEGTTAFMEQQLAQARQDLDAQEKKLKDFKSHFIGALPEQQQANLQVLGQLQTILLTNADSIDRAQQERTYLQSMLSTIAKTDDIPPGRKPLQNELEIKRALLVDAEQKYKPEHPDVIRLKHQVAALEAQSDQLAKKEQAKYPPTEDPAQKLKLQLASIDEDIKLRTRRQHEIEAKMHELQGALERLPYVEEQMASLNRDFEVSRAQYQSLLEKKDNSRMAAEMERQAEGEQFRVLDPASYPEQPYEPNVPKLLLLVVMAGLAAGGAGGFIAYARDRAIYNERDIAYYLGLPPLAALPVIVTSELVRRTRRKRQVYAIISATCVLAIAIVGYAYSDALLAALGMKGVL